MNVRVRLLSLFAIILTVFASNPSRAALVISEFLAENDGGLHDSDGDSPDWIELHNLSTNAVNLAGWRLTDTATNLSRWTFPATNLAAWWQNHCSTVQFFDGRIRVYDEILIPLLGIIVLVAVWLLLKRTRIGMIIRAGVQDRSMVEALGINVRRVFTLVFALGVGLATFGGILAAPSSGLNTGMGASLFTSALIALAIGGLTSYPGAALGSLLVGLIQQFIIKYGQIGIELPFTDIIFKPSPPLVPASTVLLMVIVLLFLPGGIMGKKD